MGAKRVGATVTGVMKTQSFHDIKNNMWKFHFPSHVLCNTLSQDPPFVGRKEPMEFTVFTLREFPELPSLGSPVNIFSQCPP